LIYWEIAQKKKNAYGKIIFETGIDYPWKIAFYRGVTPIFHVPADYIIEASREML